MTLHIDEALLKRVMAATGAVSKTQAVDLALREIDRRAELMRITKEGLGLTGGELKEIVDPAGVVNVQNAFERNASSDKRPTPLPSKFL